MSPGYPKFYIDNHLRQKQYFAFHRTNSNTRHCQYVRATKVKKCISSNLFKNLIHQIILAFISLLFAASGLIAIKEPVQYTIDIEFGDQHAARIGVSF